MITHLSEHDNIGSSRTKSVENSRQQSGLVQRLENESCKQRPRFAAVTTIADWQRRAIRLGHVQGFAAILSAVRDFHIPVQTDCQRPTQLIHGRLIQAGQERVNLRQALSRRHQITVSHFPQVASRLHTHFLCQQITQHFASVQLIVGGLTNLTTNRSKVVAINRPSSTRNRTSRSLFSLFSKNKFLFAFKPA